MRLPKIAQIIGVVSFLATVAASTSMVHATVYTWTGTTSSSIPTATNWSPTTGVTGVAGNSEDWQFPNGVGSTTPVFDGGGPWHVGGTSGGGLTFLSGAPAYTFTQSVPSNIVDLTGTNVTAGTAAGDRGILTNNSVNTQTFNMDFQSARGTIDAKSGDIIFTAGHTFFTGGTTSIASGNATRTANAGSLQTIFQGDHNIYLNSTAVQLSTGGNFGTSNARGAILYRGADTTAANAGALVLGNLGTFNGRIIVDSQNGGVVRAVDNRSFGDDTYAGSPGNGLRDTFIGNPSGGSGTLSNGVVEIDGTAGNLVIPEGFRLETRLSTGAPHIRNVAGNNSISTSSAAGTGYVGVLANGGGSADSVILESVSGKLTINGSTIFNNVAMTANVYFQGNGDFELGTSAAGVSGISEDVAGAVLNVNKRGNGTVTMQPGTTMNYAGTTTIEGGTYIMNSTHTKAGAGNYTVQAGATLGGTGVIGPNVIVNGTLSPGASVESLGTGTVTFNAGSTFKYEINSTTVTADLLNASGGLNLSNTGAGVSLALSDLGGSLLADGTKFTMIRYDGTGAVNTFAGVPNLSLVTVGPKQFRIRYNDQNPGGNFSGELNAIGSTRFVTLTAVPEATAFLTFGLSGIFAAAAVRFGKRFGLTAFKI